MKKILFVGMFAISILTAQGMTLEKIKYGDFEGWIVRTITESGIIGGNTKTLYEVGPNASITDGRAYKNMGGSPWGTSNVMAKIMGVTKGSNTVTRDTRAGGGNCAKLSTSMESVQALGVINMNVLVAGSIFLGNVVEPISSTKNPYSKMEMGVPFTKRPDYLVFDYKLIAPAGNMVYSSGFGSKKNMPGRDSAEVYILLQQRREDANGNLFAKRVGTGRQRFAKTTNEWVSQHKIPVYYGNISKHPEYKPYMGLISKANSYYARNSKGAMVPVIEEGWADENTTPTHVLVMASSGCGTAYIGTVGMTLWIDNVAFGY